MKGILLAGGSGTRLYPLTRVTSKQLLPIYDKPMIFYPLSTLMLAGIQDVLIISTPKDQGRFRSLLGDGSQYGMRFSYAQQARPAGIAEAFLIAEDYLAGEPAALILGDNIFYGGYFSRNLSQAVENAAQGFATIFAYPVPDPSRFGIVEFDADLNVLSLEEKPARPKSNYCVTGLYFYDGRVCDFARQVRPSPRGELEITDLNKLYLAADALKVQLFGRGFAWMDTGTMDSLLDASVFVQSIQKHQGLVISAPEEIAFRKGWIDRAALLAAADAYGASPYGAYLKRVAEGEVLYH